MVEKRELSPRTKFTLWKSKALAITTQLARDARTLGEDKLAEELEYLISLIWRARRRELVVILYRIWRIYGKWGKQYPNLRALLDIMPSREEINLFYHDRKVVPKEEQKIHLVDWLAEKEEEEEN